MFYIEFLLRHRLDGGVDREDVDWDRYPRPFTVEKAADTEAWWLSEWDDQYIYRVVEVSEEP